MNISSQDTILFHIIWSKNWFQTIQCISIMYRIYSSCSVIHNCTRCHPISYLLHILYRNRTKDELFSIKASSLNYRFLTYMLCFCLTEIKSRRWSELTKSSNESSGIFELLNSCFYLGFMTICNWIWYYLKLDLKILNPYI